MPGGVHEHMKAWEPEEDRLIIEMLASLGPRWSKISQALPGRSISSIRNRWQRIDKGRQMRAAGCISKNRCQLCGQPKRGHVCFESLRQKARSHQSAEDATLREILPDMDAADVTAMLMPSRGASGNEAIPAHPAAAAHHSALLPATPEMLMLPRLTLPETADVEAAVERALDEDGGDEDGDFLLASELLPDVMVQYAELGDGDRGGGGGCDGGDGGVGGVGGDGGGDGGEGGGL